MKEYKLKPQVGYYVSGNHKTIQVEFNPKELSVVSNRDVLFINDVHDEVAIKLGDDCDLYEQVDLGRSNYALAKPIAENPNLFDMKFIYYDNNKNKREIILYTSDKDLAKELYNNLQVTQPKLWLAYNEDLLNSDRHAVPKIPASAFYEGDVFEYEVYYKYEPIFSIKLYGLYNKITAMDNLLKMPENKDWTFFKTVCTE